MMKTEIVLEKSVSFILLMRLIIREKFIEILKCSRFETYVIKKNA
jgi:hypothetical protein